MTIPYDSNYDPAALILPTVLSGKVARRACIEFAEMIPAIAARRPRHGRAKLTSYNTIRFKLIDSQVLPKTGNSEVKATRDAQYILVWFIPGKPERQFN